VVVDASALVEVLLRTPRSAAILRAAELSELVAPELIVVEVLSALRRLLRQHVITMTRADEAVDDLIAAPLRHLPTLSLAEATWRLCQNLSAYDACYVALAAALDCPLVSADSRLAHAPGLPVRVIIP
jgi:predicted nucleic acid-binding protein